MSPAALLSRLVPKGRFARVVLAAASVILLLWMGRQLLVQGALWRAGSLARRLGDAARHVPDTTRQLQQSPDPLSWLLPPEIPQVGEAAPAPNTPSSDARPVQRPLAPTPTPVVILRGDVVLGLAERGAVPRGAFRAAAGDMPAGIEILDGGGLGIGWFPGDRLVQVSGVPAVDRAQVIRAVLQERAKRAPVITATLARRTREGVVTYRVLVEQPYLSGEPTSPPGGDPGASAP